MQAGGGAEAEGPAGPRRPQEELWTDEKQEWDEVGGRAEAAAGLWPLALGFGPGEAETWMNS